MGSRAVVIGAGIGGLTAAAGLAARGWSVVVHERASALEAVGAGIGVAPNGLRALDAVGAGSAVRALSAIQGEGGIRRPDGRWLSRTQSELIAQRVGAPLVVALRSDLIGILHDLLPADALRLSSTVHKVWPGDEQRPARVRTDTGTDEADLVVAADGIWSATRASVFPQYPGPRFSGFTSWRFVVPAPPGCQPAETWGPGRVFGVMPLAGDRVYCYAMTAAPAGARSDDEAASLARSFRSWHDPIPTVLARAADVAVLRGDVYELAGRLPRFHTGRVCLLGDAAHAMMPNLGQGGCQAAEDAVVLAHRVATAGSVPEGLAAYSADRRTRVARVVRLSRRMARMAQLSARPAVVARDAAVAVVNRMLPDLAARMFIDVANWRPPEPAQNGPV